MKHSLIYLACLTASTQSVPQSQPIEKIAVTYKQAYRGDIPQKQIPQSIETLDSAVLDQKGITQLQNALDFSASISRKNNSGALWGSFSIRRLSGNLINGFSGGRGFSGPRDVSKIEYIEVGAKFSYQGITGTLALFDATKSNVLKADPVNVGFSAPIGKANSKGVELDLSTYITDDTKFNLSYAYIDASTANDIVNADWGVPIKEGSPLVNVPKNNLNLTLSHQTALMSKELEFGTSYQYTSSRLGDAADLSFRLQSYQLVSVFGQVNLTERTKLNINVNNIFDEDYAESSYNALWVYPGAPTQFKMSLAYQF